MLIYPPSWWRLYIIASSEIPRLGTYLIHFHNSIQMIRPCLSIFCRFQAAVSALIEYEARSTMVNSVPNEISQKAGKPYFTCFDRWFELHRLFLPTFLSNRLSCDVPKNGKSENPLCHPDNLARYVFIPVQYFRWFTNGTKSPVNRTNIVFFRKVNIRVA